MGVVDGFEHEVLDFRSDWFTSEALPYRFISFERSIGLLYIGAYSL